MLSKLLEGGFIDKMKDEEILKKAIEKAVKGGYKRDMSSYPMWKIFDYPQLIIFSHDFAKAFFGEKEYIRKYEDGIKIEPIAWQYHLQQMVLEENKLKYLEKFL